jgi:16S rRNA (guanine966-N2)-methyltransferase
MTNANHIRIIAGQYRSRLIAFPAAEGLRPTPDRVRETLFNWLGQTLHGKRCLDLFAGSGALGFEAASRGAQQVVMVEHNRTVYQALQKNIEKLGCMNVALHHADGLEFVRREQNEYDVIFLDPPFAANYLPQLLMQPLPLAPQGRVYVECGEPLTPDANWQIVKRGRAGAVHFYLLERQTGDDQGDLSGNL